jgi:O-antigen ligase/polysaccharide polymerase Wzy-like membrane protein
MPLARRPPALLEKLDFQALSVWLLGFVLVVYLALSGGGYDSVVRNQLGIAIWWGILLGLAVGALPLSRLRAGSWIALGLLAAYVGWVALSLAWSDATAGTATDLGRVVTYLGVFALALSIRSPEGARRMAGALGAGIAVVALVALLSRLHPAWFPSARETAELLAAERNRLAYPLGYWNGVASLVAIGLPLVLYLANSARHVLTQALAAAALPAMALTVYFTFSRGGALAALLALALFLALAHDRLPRVATVVVAGAGAAILIAGAHQREALDAGLAGPLAGDQGDSLLAMTLVVCAGVGLIQAGLAIALRGGWRPTWSRPSRRFSLSLMASALLLALLAAVALGVPGKASHAWHEFRQAKPVSAGSARLGSFSSNGRWPLWRESVEEARSAPLTGDGSGSFERWWARHGDGGFVRDAHSLYFETLAELGIIGLVLIVGFLGWVLAVGIRRYLDAARGHRTQLAAALAGCVAFCFGAGFDWLWELAVIPIAFLLLASVLVSAGDRHRKTPLPPSARVAGACLAIAAMVAIAIPLSATTSLRQSQAEARAADFSAALREARDAAAVEPFSAAPPLQEALVLEAQGSLASAATAIAVATRREPDEWRAWLIRSRIEAERGNASAAVADFRRARALNPHSLLFRQR